MTEEDILNTEVLEEEIESLSEKDREILREQAKFIYITQGKSKTEIAESVSLKPSTIGSWMRKYNWKEEKLDYLNKLSKEQLSTTIQHLNADTATTLKTLQTIKKKVETALGEDNVKPFKFTDAVNTFLETVRLERQLKQEAFEFTFITEIAKILREEIHDEDEWIRIRIRVGRLLGIDKFDRLPKLTEGIIEHNIRA